MSCPSQLKTVSRTRSGVGRRWASSGKCNMRLRHLPPMMRTLFFKARVKANGRAMTVRPIAGQSVLFRFHRPYHDGHHSIRIDPTLEGILDLGNGHICHRLHVVIQIGERQVVETDHGEVSDNLFIAVYS